MGDLISSLPTDESIVSPEERTILNSISVKEVEKSHPGKHVDIVRQQGTHIQGSQIVNEVKNVAIVTLLFVLCSSEFIGKLINKLVPKAEEYWYLNLAIRIVLFAALYFLVINISLVKQ